MSFMEHWSLSWSKFIQQCYVYSCHCPYKINNLMLIISTHAHEGPQECHNVKMFMWARFQFAKLLWLCLSLEKIGLVIMCWRGGQAGARRYNTSLQREGYRSSVQDQEQVQAKCVCCKYWQKSSSLLNYTRRAPVLLRSVSCLRCTKKKTEIVTK
jgi:hypothetical protein